MKRQSLMTACFLILACYGVLKAYELKDWGWNWIEETPKVVCLWINPNCEDTEGEYDAITNAYNTWSDVSTNFAFDYEGVSTATDFTYGNGVNDMCWNSGTNPVKPNSAACTRIWDDENGGIFQADVVFYDGIQWEWSTNPGSNEIDVESIALHELGHVLGLADVTNSVPVMYQFYYPGEIQRTLESDDVNGMKAIYGLVLTEPNGSETWNVGTSYGIEWTHDGVSGNVDIILFRDWHSGAEYIVQNTANDGSYNWTATVPVSDDCRIRVRLHDDIWIYDNSDANFTVAGYTVTYPTASGIQWHEGVSYTITWTSEGNPGNVDIFINRTYPSSNWEALAYNESNDGEFPWTVTIGGGATSTNRIRVENATTSSNCDISKNNFTIIENDGLAGRFLSEINPNPFNSSTRIHYQIPAATRVTLTIYDVTGRRVTVLEDRNMDSGEHETIWDASNMPSGVYFLHMNTKDFQDTKKLLLLK